MEEAAYSPSLFLYEVVKDIGKQAISHFNENGEDNDADSLADAGQIDSTDASRSTDPYSIIDHAILGWFLHACSMTPRPCDGSVHEVQVGEKTSEEATSHGESTAEEKQTRLWIKYSQTEEMGERQ